MRALKVGLVAVVTTLGALVGVSSGASAAPIALTASFDYDTTLLGAPLSVDATFTLSDVTATSENVAVTGTLVGAASYAGVTLSVSDTITAVFTPTCGTTQAVLNVDVGSFDVVFQGVTYAVDPAAFNIAASTSYRVGALICALDNALADSADAPALRQLIKLGFAAA